MEPLEKEVKNGKIWKVLLYIHMYLLFSKLSPTDESSPIQGREQSSLFSSGQRVLVVTSAYPLGPHKIYLHSPHSWGSMTHDDGRKERP